MIETTGDLITFVLRASGINGIGQTPSAEDANTGLEFVRTTISLWQRKRWLIWNEVELSKVSTGANYYSIGPGQDFDSARPDKIHAAWCRMQPFGGPNPVDISLAIIEAKEDWSGITIKDLKSIPAAVFYDSSWPIGRVYFWPVPPGGQYEMHLVVKATLPTYTTLTDPLALPPEYLEALIWTLCVKMQMSYGLPARQDHAAAMKVAIDDIKMANAQIPLLSMPAALVGRGGDVSSWQGKGLNQAWIVGGGSVLS
ncbi:MAG TPA: hypothetical protein VGH84_09360 [Steroidobacteraceae bacterium]